jgi:hypothetical protein
MKTKLCIGVSMVFLAVLWGASGQCGMRQEADSADRVLPTPAEAAGASAADTRERAIDEVIRQVATSGQIIELGASCSERLSLPARVAPGEPPLLRFRYLQGADHMRFGKLDLVVDDAGH